MCTQPLSAGGEGVEPPIKSSKRGRPDRTSTCLRDCLERGGEFFQGAGGGCNFHIKKLKSDIFNDEKV